MGWVVSLTKHERQKMISSYQTIVTKLLPPTHKRGQRIKVTAYAGSIIVPYEGSERAEREHEKAAIEFMKRKGWDHGIIGGASPKTEREMFWVLTEKSGQ